MQVELGKSVAFLCDETLVVSAVNVIRVRVLDLSGADLDAEHEVMCWESVGDGVFGRSDLAAGLAVATLDMFVWSGGCDAGSCACP